MSRSFSERLRGLEAAITRGVSKSMVAAGELIETEAAISMTRGRAEVVDKSKHVPSRPGEPPAVYEGDLRRSLETVQIEPLAVEVAARDPKARLLEFGTSKMAERPFMRPAVDKKKREAIDLLHRAASSAIRRHFRR